MTIVPGVMMLVPGSLGFKSLSSLLASDVLSGLDDGQARELLLRELDRQVLAREAELAAAGERKLGALLGEWGLALGRGWIASFKRSTLLPAAAAETLDNFQARRGDASLWRLGGIRMG